MGSSTKRTSIPGTLRGSCTRSQKYSATKKPFDWSLKKLEAAIISCLNPRIKRRTQPHDEAPAQDVLQIIAWLVFSAHLNYSQRALIIPKQGLKKNISEAIT